MYSLVQFSLLFLPCFFSLYLKINEEWEITLASVKKKLCFFLVFFLFPKREDLGIACYDFQWLTTFGYKTDEGSVRMIISFLSFWTLPVMDYPACLPWSLNFIILIKMSFPESLYLLIFFKSLHKKA